MLNLNLGCGFKKLDGFLNINRHPAGPPDAVVDLESLSWPWDDDSVDQVVLCHVLEHLGKRTFSISESFANCIAYAGRVRGSRLPCPIRATMIS